MRIQKIGYEPSRANTRICAGLSGLSEQTTLAALAYCWVNVALQFAWTAVDAIRHA
jgi:hypothetical protein